MKRKGNRFVFTPEMGERLRLLRMQKGLSLAQMAARLGRKGSGAKSLVTRLEKGRAKNPTLGLVADYLRACGSSFNAISDLLNKYTHQPIGQAELQVEVKVEEKSEPVKPKFVRTSEQKAKRMREGYLLKLLRRDVEERLYSILKELGDEVARTSACGGLCRYGRRWFDILWRTRERQKSRERQLKKELTKGVPEGLKPQWIERVRAEMESLVKERMQNLPIVPENAHPGMLATVLKAEDRFLGERMRLRFQQDRLRVHRLAMFAPDILTYLQGQRLRDRDIQNFNLRLFPELMRICEDTKEKPKERQRQIEALIQPWLKFPQTRQVVEMFLQGYEKWKNWPPKG